MDALNLLYKTITRTEILKNNFFPIAVLYTIRFEDTRPGSARAG